MKFLILLSLFTLSLATLQTSTKPLRFVTRCRPQNIQRDALCGCYLVSQFGLSDRSFTRRCMALFRVGRRALKRSCRSYSVRTSRGKRIQSRRLLANLRFIANKCPRNLRRAGVDVSTRMLNNFQIVQAINDILDFIRELLGLLQPVPAMSPPPGRMIVAGEAGRKIARLAAYNNIQN